MPSNKKFGLTISCVFLLLTLFSEQELKFIFLTAAIISLFLSYKKPSLLNFFNKAWFKLGHFLGKISSPIAMGIIFFCIITPVGFLYRIFGNDVLRLKKAKKTYWIYRHPSGPKNNSFKNQF